MGIHSRSHPSQHLPLVVLRSVEVAFLLQIGFSRPIRPSLVVNIVFLQAISQNVRKVSILLLQLGIWVVHLFVDFDKVVYTVLLVELLVQVGLLFLCEGSCFDEFIMLLYHLKGSRSFCMRHGGGQLRRWLRR